MRLNADAARAARGPLFAVGVLGALMLGASHLLTHCSHSVEAAQAITLRVRLDDAERQTTIEGAKLQTQPSPPFEIGARLEIRTQSRGLLLLTENGDAWALDSAEGVRVSWEGPARIVAGDKASRREREAQHHGNLVVRASRGALRRVLHTDLELYTSGVLAAEMSPSWPAAALEAQAIAARSFALTARARRRKLDFDVFDDDRDQVYRGARDDPSLVRAVRNTRGQVLRYDGKILRAYYSSTCGGMTREGFERFRDVPRAPFRSVVCEGCADSPRYRWTRTIARSRLAQLGVSARGSLNIRPTKRSGRGDWMRMSLTDARGVQREVAARRLHALRALPSLWLDSVRARGAVVEVRGRGFGHGVGLCQYGARGYARGGWSARDILAHYFPGAEIGMIDAPTNARD